MKRERREKRTIVNLINYIYTIENTVCLYNTLPIFMHQYRVQHRVGSSPNVYAT